ncbi:MAG TPA: MaoC/PaaZ C-terminal domain-containing protein [Spirochaetota bacterium]|nr:MaoC/PaaZ C-terminal domain-containing protein [Spirochaetota bacterium]HPJ33553.1 MaoC/PaaZ C-terminal domain-containing protein [Spirochaetota bacterium]
MILDNLSIFRAMAKNYNSPGMNRNMIGYTIKENFGHFTMREVRAYVEATGDDISRYGSQVPPFFFSRRLYPLFKKVITHRDLGMDLLRMVHGQQSLKCYEPISLGENFQVEVKIADIIGTPAGEMLLIRTSGFKSDRLILESDTGLMVRNRKKIDIEGGGPSPKRKKGKKLRGGDIKLLIRTFRGQQKKYAKVSKDTNPIHTSEFFARLAGLPGTILHGVCVIAMCANSLVDYAAERDPARMKFVSARFAYPVIPGDTLTLVGSRIELNGEDEIEFDVYNSRGRTVVKRGAFACT